MRPIKAVNTSLLTKWLWRLSSEGESPWKAIHYRLSNCGWAINPVLRRTPGMWRAIAACVDKFKESIRFKVGHGDRIKFWTDS